MRHAIIVSAFVQRSVRSGATQLAIFLQIHADRQTDTQTDGQRDTDDRIKGALQLAAFAARRQMSTKTDIL